MSDWIFEQTVDWWQELLGQPPVLATFDPLLAAASIPRSDVGASRIVQAKFDMMLTFVDKTEEWHMWDGRVHAPLESPATVKLLIAAFADALRDALDFVESFYEMQAQTILAAGGQNAQKDAQKRRDEYRKTVFLEHRHYRDRLYSSQGINGMFAALQTECTIESGYYNNDRQWLVVRNGVIDLHTIRDLGENEFPTLLPHDPTRPVTRYFDADYDLGATSPAWLSFLSRSLPDPDTRRFLMKASGAAFMAVEKLKVIPNLQGPKDSGKSVFTDVLRVLGGGYSCEPTPTALLKVTGTNFEQDALRNKRFVTISEPDEKIPLDDGFVKRVSGGDWTETRTLHAKSSGWYPQCVMMIASNHVVKFNTRDDALLDRVALVKFPIQFLPGDHVPENLRFDPDLKDKLFAERSGILNWIIWGMKFFIAEGMESTNAIIENRREMQAAGSTALQWVHEMEEEGWIQVIDQTDAAHTPKSHFIQVVDAYAHYQLWCVQAGEKYPLTRKFFSKDVQSRYGQAVQSGGYRFPRLLWTEQWNERHASTNDANAGFKF